MKFLFFLLTVTAIFLSSCQEEQIEIVYDNKIHIHEYCDIDGSGSDIPYIFPRTFDLKYSEDLAGVFVSRTYIYCLFGDIYYSQEDSNFISDNAVYLQDVRPNLSEGLDKKTGWGGLLHRSTDGDFNDPGEDFLRDETFSMGSHMKVEDGFLYITIDNKRTRYNLTAISGSGSSAGRVYDVWETIKIIEIDLHLKIPLDQVQEVDIFWD